VLLFGRGRKGKPCQVLAVVCAALGIVIGKYGTFYYFFMEGARGQGGEALADSFGLFSPEILQAFVGSVGDWISGYDLLWIGLAVVSAWGIPRERKPVEAQIKDAPPQAFSDQGQHDQGPEKSGPPKGGGSTPLG
jgi:hypothetical protein